MIQDALAQIDDPAHLSCTSSAGKTPDRSAWNCSRLSMPSPRLWSDPRRLPGVSMSGLITRRGAAPCEQGGVLG